jgi:nicotinate-nucleotide adenylyltransferase
MSRTGVFGGTFDPPHLGHLIVAQDVVEELGLDRLLMITAAESPHKPDSARAPAQVRARMVEAALGTHPHLQASRIEVDRGGPSYTVDTLRELGESCAGDELFLVIGADQLHAFGTWRAPHEVARLARLIVMARGGVRPEGTTPGIDVPYEAVPVTRVDISSTEVRRRVAAGRSIRYWVPNGVLEIIREEKLYGIR